MEEKKLRNRLIGLYVATVALVLGGLLAAVIVMSSRESQNNRVTNFSTLFHTAAERLQTSATLQHDWLRQMEVDHALYIEIVDNGEQTIYNSADSAERSALFATARALAIADGVTLEAAPLYTAKRTSPVYEFHQDGGRYVGAYSIIPVAGGYRSLLIVQREQPFWPVGRIALFAAAYALGVGLLCRIGVQLINRALRPAVESRKRQVEFIASASHELRSPLAVISANAATIAEFPENTATAVASIENECTRMSRLIGDMLLLASMDAKSWPMVFAPVDLDTLLLSVYEAYLPVAKVQGFTLALLLPENALPSVKGDAERLSQVMGILLDNAMGYNHAADNKSIEIQAYAQKNQVMIEVIDHGVGIAAEEKPYLFLRFHRGDRAHKDRQHFGLGLAIAHELVALHHGSISLHDTPGGGCTFRVSFS